MKIIGMLLILLISFPTFASNPTLEIKAEKESIQKETKALFEEVFKDEISKVAASISNKERVIIIDENFNTVREESVDNIEKLSNQSILVPTIYRSQFISKIYNVSYYMLKKR